MVRHREAEVAVLVMVGCLATTCDSRPSPAGEAEGEVMAGEQMSNLQVAAIVGGLVATGSAVCSVIMAWRARSAAERVEQEARIQAARSEYLRQLDVVIHLEREYESAELRKARARTASYLLGLGDAIMCVPVPTEAAQSMQTLLQYFERIGLLVRREVLSIECVWFFLGCRPAYWALAAKYHIDSLRFRRKASFEETIALRDKILRHEAERAGSSVDEVTPTADELKMFLESESSICGNADGG